MPPLISLQSISNETPVEIMQVDGGTVTFGRGPDNHIVVDSDAVSRRHGCLVATDNHWIYQDLQSTNGSWVNGVKLATGQARLLRHNDVVQLADFPMRIVEVNHVEIPNEQAAASVLVFYTDHFEGEFPLESAGSKFALGGPEGQFFIEGVEQERVQLEVVHNGWRLELTTNPGGLPVIVNGMAARGVTALNDRDEIGIDSYRLIINDLRSASPVDQSKPKAAKNAKTVQAYERPNAPEHLLRQNTERGTDWESEASKRRALSGKKFVFGSEMEENETTTTIGAVGATGPRYGGGSGAFEMSVSQRFSAAVLQAEKKRPPAALELLITLFGVFVFLGVLGAVIWLGLLFFGR